ncbi:MAG: type II secretion system protein [Christensenellales bacterium]|nr:type II secretion system protein [Christensenellales bacterium]
MRKLAKLLKNKKGFTLVEAIAVVAIMGILATVIGGLVTAGTTAYMRQKENAAAKDLGTIVQNEIKRAARSSVEVYLQDGALPTADNMITIDDNQTPYTMKNPPTGEYKVFSSSEAGRLVYSTDSGKTTENTKDYFTSSAAEERAFYGSFTIKVYFRAIVNTFKEITSVKVFCDVYNAKGQRKFDSPGLEIDFIEADYSQSEGKKFVGIFSFEQGNIDAIDEKTGQYKNMLLDANYKPYNNNEKGFKNFYFRTVTGG